MKTLITLSLILSLSLNGYSQTDLELVDRTLSRGDIKSHIDFIASDELRGRQTGSPEIDIAAKYLASRMEAYGVQPIDGSYYQDVELVQTSYPTTLKWSFGDSTYDFEMISGSRQNLDAKAIYLEYGTEADFENVKVEGKIVVTKAGEAGDFDMMKSWYASKDKIKRAQENGALALLEIAPDDAQWIPIKNHVQHEKMVLKEEYSTSNFVHGWVEDSAGLISNSLSPKKSFKSNILVEGIANEEVKGKNVVGIIEGADAELKDEYVIYSAHYDHIGVGQANAEGDSIFNGARDNAIGTVTLLSTAKNLGQFPTKRSALFIFFTAEEKGLLGSKYYVNHPLIPLNKMVYCFNSDNAGYNDTTKATIFGMEKSTNMELITKGAAAAGLEAIQDPIPEQKIYTRSDHYHFAQKGVPSVLYGVGVTAFDSVLMSTYHQASDNPETLDFDYLEKFFRAYVYTARLIANDSETPFWVEGDEYYEKGKALYGE